MEEAGIMERLSSASKLDRDKAIRQLSEAVEKREGSVIETVFENLLGIRQQFKDDYGSLSWEQKLGYLTAYTILLKSEKKADIDTDHLISVCLDWIETESDVRVREAVAQLLGALTECQGVLVLERSRSRLLGLARSHLQRRIEPDRELSDAAERGKLMDRKEWKNLAAWKDLELCLNCLAKIFTGLGSSINGQLDAETLDILLTCVTHQNRFVRDTGYKVLKAVLVEQQQKTDDEDRCTLISEHLASGLSDNWSMVRLSSLQATRQFLLSLPPSNRVRHYPVLLPRICLNRYFSAEGVKLQAQRAWVDICGQEGRALLSQHIEATVAYYRGCTEAESQPVREAACHCLAEVASKLDPEAVSPHLASILQCLTCLTSDPCWPVRDAASLATSILAKSHPASCQSEVDTLLGIYLSNLRHGMAPVRLGAAMCLANIATVFPEVMPRMVTAIRQGLSDLEEQPRDPRSDYNSSSSSISAVAGLSKGDIGGCTEAIGLQTEAQPWEVAEASVLAMAELCKVKQCQEAVSKLIPEMFQSCRSRRSDTQTISFCATVVRKLAEIVTVLDKRFWKPHLELEVVFTCLESDHPGARAAGEQCLQVLGRVLGPSILRGRVENYLPQYLQTHDAIILGSGLPPPMGRVSTSSSFPMRPPFASSKPMVMTPRASEGSHPLLGGTPPA